MSLSESEITHLIASIAAEISSVSGVAAVALGGSRSRNSHTPASDIDMGIYYHPSVPLDLAALTELAGRLDDQHRENLLTPIGGWGPRINGGGWLTVRGIPVDFVYRDLQQVGTIIDECYAGQIRNDYQPGHPFGFGSHIYMGETAVCQPLYDPHGHLEHLKARTVPYPQQLRKAVIGSYFWDADFTLLFAQKGVKRADSAYVAGCCFRSLNCLLQTLFALNGVYWLNEKGALALADSFLLKPDGLKQRVEKAFASFPPDPAILKDNLLILDGLVKETAALMKEL